MNRHAITQAQRHENAMLRSLLDTLGRDAAHNQQVLTRFHERELALLGAADLVRLLDCLSDGMRRSFSLDAVRLLLLDPFDVIRDLLPAAFKQQGGLRDIALCRDVRATRALFDDLHHPSLGAWRDDAHLPLFGRRIGGSVALLPLRQPDGLAGFLCLGSRDRDRFQAANAHDFLAHLATVAAVCLENAVNRERLRLAGLTDSLTGLYNRRHLQHRLEQEVTRAQRHAQPLSCLFVDADHFKRINDRHGHVVGDRALVALAQGLRARLRASDLAARYGGEEFAVLLPQTDGVSAYTLAQDICHAIATTPIELDAGDPIGMTVSIGVSTLPDGPPRSSAAAGEALLRAADAALYRAKTDGRNRAVYADAAARPRADSNSHDQHKAIPG